jgi:hypothetical protein
MVLFKFKYWIPLAGVYFVEKELAHVIKTDLTEQFPLWAIYQAIFGLIFITLFGKFFIFHFSKFF